MESLDEFFDRVYVISLPNPEREAKMREQLDSLGLYGVFVHAEVPPPEFTMNNMRRNPRMEFGANLSHLKAIQMSVVARDKRPLFLEDDVEFLDPDRLMQILPERAA